LLGMRQEMRMQQRLAPQLIQSLHLLQLPALDLEQVVRQELEINPLLEEVQEVDEVAQEDETDAETEVDESADSDMKDAADSETDDGLGASDEFGAEEWSAYLEDAHEMSNSFRAERDESAEIYEAVPVYEETLADDLAEQLRLIVTDEDDIAIGEYIIGNIDDDGFLTVDIEEIAESLDVPVERVAAVLAKIQTLEPPGIGARDLRESLLIQLRDKGFEEHPVYRILDTAFDEFMHKRTKEIMRRLRLEKEDIADSMEIVATLNPKPASLVYGQAERVITPDLIVEKTQDDYAVMLNDRSTPSLRISPSYRDLLSQSKSDETKKYVVDRLNSAKWLIKSIEQRRTTMVKVMTAIVRHQRTFFDEGIEQLRPMVLQEIADEIEMHVSTVSRVSNGKYVQTPHGIFELKYFFDGRLGVADGVDVASKAVKDRIRRLIEDEDKQKPLSDQAIADHLSTQDSVEIARRTVAKYRDHLRIPSARLRKEV
jgi:RNA polymerase sigma-54 factor